MVKKSCWKKASNSNDRITTYGSKKSFRLVNIRKSNNTYFVTHSNLRSGRLNQRIGSSKDKNKALLKARIFMKKNC